MPSSTVVSTSWYRALTLAERIALRLADSTAGPPADPANAADAERARQRLAQWRDLSPFRDGPWLARRLEQDGLDEESFARLIAEPAEDLGARLLPPPWLLELERASGEPAPTAATAEGPLPIPESLRGNPMTRFLELVRPLIQRARGRLRAGIAGLVRRSPGAPFESGDAERLASETLPHRLVPLLARTLTLELNVARLQGLLPGTTPEERFAAFAERLRDPEVAAAILQEYPVLARMAAEELEVWVETSLEVLDHLAADWTEIVTTFFGGRDPGPLTALDGGAGDRHRGGRAVCIAGFAAGERLVYKPRPLAVDVHVWELLEWLNTRGDHATFRTLTVLDRGDHGWVELAAAAGCGSGQEVALYHRRLGGLLALLYALEATDFHYENLIAAGEQPVLVDLESLFHPRIELPEPPRPDERLATRDLAHSVLRVGLLPLRVGESDEFEGVDISGVARVAGQPTPQKVIRWQALGTDEMRVVRDRVPMEGGSNRPTLEGCDVEAADYVEEMAAGFAEIYRLLVRHRDELLAPGGLLDRFAADPVRAVLRPTQLYGLLLAESTHPDVLRDALDRDLLFDRLWVGVVDNPALAPAIPAEHRDLVAGDIPSFGARPGSADLWTSRGERIPDFFAEPALSAVRRRLLAMGEDDLRRQSWLLRLALGTQRLNQEEAAWRMYDLADPGPELPAAGLRPRLLAAARAVGVWFAEMALRDDFHATWIGLDYRNRRWSMTPMAEDLYAGLPGIALFLGYLGALTGEAGPADLARAAMRSLVARLEGDGAEKIESIGAFQGWGGAVYAAAHLGSLWHDADLFASAESMAERIAERIDRDEHLDAVAGVAGAIFSLLALDRASGSRRARDVAVRCGERLLVLARPTASGLAWLTYMSPDQPPIGFSHGVAGIGLALVRLGAATGERRFTDAGLAALAWEREAFWPELRRWLECGEGPPPLESTVAMAWCYGAPGVGLSRLEALEAIADPAAREPLAAELRDAVRQTLEHGFGKNHCLCHGDLGNLDFLLLAQGHLHDAELGTQIQRLGRAVLADVERHGWRCGTRDGVESPALMNGFAGIGYGLLRLAEPDRVPSVLALAPPKRPGRD